MAEFKLGRLRFVWKNEWASGTTYYQDDVVAFGGKIYICVIGHIGSADFFSDLDIVPPKWNLVSDGQTWRGDWLPQTRYIYDDIVRYGGRLYICQTIHTSAEDSTTGLEADISNWQIFAEGLDWKGNWTPSFDYKINDLVKYGGSSYVCNNAHIAAATTTLGLEEDLDKWDLFNQGFDYKGQWSASNRYKVNDVVKFGSTTYICTVYHTSGASFQGDNANWTKFVEGVQYESEWNYAREYQAGDIVSYGGNQYVSTTNHSGIKPGVAAGDITNITNADPAVVTSANHQLLNGEQITITTVVGMTDVNSRSFYVNNVTDDTFELFTDSALTVSEDSSAYNAYSSGGVWDKGLPADWNLLSEGLKFLGDWGDDSSSVYYRVGEVVRLGAYTYKVAKDHVNKQPPNTDYWTRLNAGINWRGDWLDDQEYFLGDTVRYGDNSYICVQGHVSEGDDFSTETKTQPGGGAENSRPDLDTSGTYWNIIAVGTEQSVLTTTGDLVYYSASGPARLPIGVNGQILSVGANGVPEWATLGSADDVYYVAEYGIDSPAPEYGKSIDRPWKTIRYACQQVELGAKAKNAARLLELNRRFIQREIVEWTDYQIANNTAPFTTSFEYNSAKCERDMGLLIDAFIWDLKHGGNSRSRAAALKYVNEPGQFYVLGQEAETVASINYGLTVIEAVLSQEAPDVNYQVLNGDNSTAIVEQYFEAALGNQADAEYESSISGAGATVIGYSGASGGGGSESGYGGY